MTESGSTAAQQLHPTVLHDLVNTLGWCGLRPAQRAAVGPLVAGGDLVMVAPTARREDRGRDAAAVVPDGRA
jgi:hypothetical protein